MHEITLCDVGPRDGLQSEKRMFSVAERIELIDRLSAAKVPVIEAVSFVNPKKVPQMAEPEQVLAGIQR
ncbi:MAG: hydroxymethylglutaryl-CoA lyase, partial [Candidatus Competibacteraceae bacterium]|nr:hydroxymethylglutaryl-CoA lyase [Candidatus Competibacteraceae bacterium]